MEKNLQFLDDKGLNIADPVVINIASSRATQDAARAVYLNSNIVVSGYHALNKIASADTKDGRYGGKVIAKMLEADNLIVKVPTNFIAEQLESSPFGAVATTVEVLNKFRKGINDLPPEVADRLARRMVNATSGTIAFAVGGLLYLNHFGGNKYIRTGQNSAEKEKDNMKEGEMNVLGVDIPHYMQHSAYMQMMQMGAGTARMMDHYNKLDIKHGMAHENHFLKGLIGAEGSTIAGTPILKSAKEYAEAADSPEGLTKLMAHWIDAAMAVPGAVAKATDDQHRTPKTLMEHVKSNIPGLRKAVPSKEETTAKARMAKMLRDAMRNE